MNAFQRELKRSTTDLKRLTQELRSTREDEASDAAILVDCTNALQHARTTYVKQTLREMVADAKDELANTRDDIRDLQREIRDCERDIADIKEEMKNWSRN